MFLVSLVCGLLTVGAGDVLFSDGFGVLVMSSLAPGAVMPVVCVASFS